MHEILGTLADRAAGVRQRGAGLGQLGDPRARRDARAEGPLPAPAARRRSEVGVQHDRARHRRLGPDAAEDRARSRDGDEWVINGHKWFSSNGSIADFLIVMAVTDPDARPHQRASMFIVDADTPGVKILRDVATMEHPWDSFGRYGNHAEIVYEDVRVPAEALLGAAGRRLPDRPAAAVSGPDPPLHALARGRAAGVRHAVRALAVPLRARLDAARSTRRSRTGSPTPRRRCRRRG